MEPMLASKPASTQAARQSGTAKQLQLPDKHPEETRGAAAAATIASTMATTPGSSSALLLALGICVFLFRSFL